MFFYFQVREHWRKIVTGDPKKRVTDYMHETPQVKMKDKFSVENVVKLLDVCIE